MEAPFTPQKYAQDLDKINWTSGSIFILLHLACILIFWVDFSWFAVIALCVTYSVRMFAITAGFHRYFSHRTFKTSRPFQFLLAWLGTTSAQKGPLWWAAHHRHHHKYSDTEKDLSKFPELKILNKLHLLPPIQLAVGTFVAGELINYYFPALGTSGFQLLVYGFIISTVLLYYGTYTVNSLAHLFDKRRFETKDDSRNNWFISIITPGEGWHNNHLRFPSSERQGFYWWQFDISHYVLKILSWFGIVWDLRVPPKRMYAESTVFKRPPEVIENP